VHAGTAAVTVATVEHSRAIRVTLQLDVGSDPLSGTVSIEGRQQRRFQGWIELAAAIESARAGGTAEREEAPDPPAERQ
jgi:hypothetical protein